MKNKDGEIDRIVKHDYRMTKPTLNKTCTNTIQFSICKYNIKKG